MYYCEKCMLLTPENHCPACGTEYLQAPKDDQPCFLIEKDALWSGMLADVLEQNNIPFLQKPQFDAVIAAIVGPAVKRYRFYIPFAFYADAQVIVEELFGETSEE